MKNYNYVLVLISDYLDVVNGPKVENIIKVDSKPFYDYAQAVGQCKKLNNHKFPCWVPCELRNTELYYKDVFLFSLRPKEYITNEIGCWIEAIQVGKHRAKAYYQCKTLEEGWNILKEYNNGCMLSMFYEPGEMQEGDGLICKTFDDLLKYIYE